MFDYILGFLVFLSLYKHVNLFLIKRRLRRREEVKIMEGAEPFFLEAKTKRKKNVGALLIHGFTASPHELKELGHYLQKQGITVYAPLLSGHGTIPEQMLSIKYETWIHDVEKALTVLEGSCDEIYLVGSSFGGNLAFLVGEKQKKVKGIIALATPFIFRREKVGKLVLSGLRHIKLFQKKRYPKRVQNIYAKGQRVAYTQVPLSSLVQLLKVVKNSREVLPEITKPVLLIQSTDDNVVSEESVNQVITRIRSQKKKVVWIPHSIHVFILDEKRHAAFHEINSFIKRVQSS